MTRERALSGSIAFVRGCLGLLSGLSLFGLLLVWVGYAIDKPPGVNAEVALLFAHAALVPLCVSSSVGLIWRRRWAWWTGLAAFGLLAAMAAFILVLTACPRSVMGGLVDPDWWPLAAVYAACAAPGAFLLRPGRAYREDLR